MYEGIYTKRQREKITECFTFYSLQVLKLVVVIC